MLLVTWFENWIIVTVCNCVSFLSPIGPHIWFCVSTILLLLGWLYSVVWDQASGCFQHCPYLFRVSGSSLLFVCLFVLCLHKISNIFFQFLWKILMRIMLSLNAAFKNMTFLPIVVLLITFLCLSYPCYFYPWKFFGKYWNCDIFHHVINLCLEFYYLLLLTTFNLSHSCFSRPWVASLDYLLSLWIFIIKIHKHILYSWNCLSCSPNILMNCIFSSFDSKNFFHFPSDFLDIFAIHEYTAQSPRICVVSC